MPLLVWLIVGLVLWVMFTVIIPFIMVVGAVIFLVLIAHNLYQSVISQRKTLDITPTNPR